jgi:hypothetical protein
MSEWRALVQGLRKFVTIDQGRLVQEIVATFRASGDENPEEPALRRFRRAVVSSWRRSA